MLSNALELLGRRRSQATPQTPPAADAPLAPDGPPPDLAGTRETIDLIETDLAAMIRDVQCASDSVRQGIKASGSSLAAIRERSASLAALARSAKADAIQLASATEEFSQCSGEIDCQVREAGTPT